MRTSGFTYKSTKQAFTFVEAIVTIAIIGIMASMMVAAFSNASKDANRAVARQQQAALQGALNAWITGDSNRVTVTGTVAKRRTIEELRVAYNAMTTTQRLAAVEGYLTELQAGASSDMFWITDTTRVRSRALDSNSNHLTLPNWDSTAQPMVRFH